MRSREDGGLRGLSIRGLKMGGGRVLHKEEFSLGSPPHFFLGLALLGNRKVVASSEILPELPSCMGAEVGVEWHVETCMFLQIGLGATNRF